MQMKFKNLHSGIMELQKKLLTCVTILLVDLRISPATPDLPPVHPRQPKSPLLTPPPPPPHPPATATPAPPPPSTCPEKLGACVDVLGGGLIGIGIGLAGGKEACCAVLGGLLDLDAALCLCAAMEAKLLDVGVFLPAALVVLGECGKTPPPGFRCPA